jgi:hypothetical protein
MAHYIHKPIFMYNGATSDKAMKNLESQDTFPSLNVVDVQDDDWMHKLVNHTAISGSVSTKDEQLMLNNKSSYCDEVFFIAILDAWDAYIAHEIKRTQDAKTAAVELIPSAYCEHIFEPQKHTNNSGPPKRFRRRGATWKTITNRMVDNEENPAGPCSD